MNSFHWRCRVGSKSNLCAQGLFFFFPQEGNGPCFALPGNNITSTQLRTWASSEVFVETVLQRVGNWNNCCAPDRRIPAPVPQGQFFWNQCNFSVAHGQKTIGRCVFEGNSKFIWREAVHASSTKLSPFWPFIPQYTSVAYCCVCSSLLNLPLCWVVGLPWVYSFLLEFHFQEICPRIPTQFSFLLLPSNDVCDI